MEAKNWKKEESNAKADWLLYFSVLNIIMLLKKIKSFV